MKRFKEKITEALVITGLTGLFISTTASECGTITMGQFVCIGMLCIVMMGTGVILIEK